MTLPIIYFNGVPHLSRSKEVAQMEKMRVMRRQEEAVPTFSTRAAVLAVLLVSNPCDS
jgi:hypothetical protein